MMSKQMDVGTERLVEASRRIFLPTIVHAKDVAEALCVTDDEAQTLLENGDLGPTFEMAGKTMILKDSMLTHLAILSKRGRPAGELKTVHPHWEATDGD